MNPSGSYSGAIAADFSSRIARLMFYIVLCLVLMTLDFRGQWVERIRDTSTLLVEPFWLLVEAPATLSRSLKERWQDRSSLLAERDALQVDLNRSRARLLVLDELERENDRLRELLEASQRIDRGFQAVELRQLDLNPYSHRLLVDRGADQGLRVGQPVMDAHGLVGQVDEVFVHSASVILLSDPDHALPVEVERSRVRTIAYGSGRSGELTLNDLPMNADIQPGDVLLSSGLGGRFQAGLPVADVLSVDRSSGEAFASATARVRARMRGARHLLVVTQGTAAILAEQDSSIDDQAASASSEPVGESASTSETVPASEGDGP
ncbi:MAG: rod shape-determining protein MreC [Pseudomonadota bacterium]